MRTGVYADLIDQQPRQMKNRGSPEGADRTVIHGSSRQAWPAHAKAA